MTGQEMAAGGVTGTCERRPDTIVEAATTAKYGQNVAEKRQKW
jgi:hypothetical protein